MKKWKGIQLPEVPPEFEWAKGAEWPLVLNVVGSEEGAPFVLWADEYVVRIAPLSEGAPTWVSRGLPLEDSLHKGTAYVLLGMWEGDRG